MRVVLRAIGHKAKAPRSDESPARWETRVRLPWWDDDEPEQFDTVEGLCRAECGLEFHRMLLSLKGSKASAMGRGRGEGIGGAGDRTARLSA